MTTQLQNTLWTMLILGILGFILKKTKVTDKRTDKFLSVLLVNVCTPALMIHTTLTSFSLSIFRSSWLSILMAIVSMVVVSTLAYGLAKALQKRGMELGAFVSMGTFSNAIFIGLPMITGIFGEGGIPYLMLYYIANTLTFWTLGIYLLSKSHGQGFSSKNLLKIFNPPILSFILGIILLTYGVSLPSYVFSSLEYLKSLLTPLSLLFMGSVIGDLSLKNADSPVVTFTILLLRFVVSPLVCLLLLKIFAIPPELGKVFLVCSGLPVMTNISIAIGRYGGNPSYASFMTALSTVIFMFIIPFYLQLMTFL